MSAADAARPEVSVIIATYNRSNVLRHAVRSVLWQSFSDWELWVIGDACTDDTAEVMAAFGDARIRFRNLPVNTGNMAGPHNEAARLVRGRFIAYLNHDDLWLPDHLETALRKLRDTDADLVYAEVLEAHPEGRLDFQGLAPGPVYDPHRSIPASSWVLRRQVLDAVGPWRSPDRIYNVPSQDWLFRAWRRRMRMLRSQPPTVLSLPSGYRQACYRDRADREQALYAARIAAEPGFRVGELKTIACRQAQALLQPHWLLKPRTCRSFVRSALFALHHWPLRLLLRIAPRLGISPLSIEYFFRYRIRGGFIRDLQRIRGLESE